MSGQNHNERGAALITVMFVFSLAAIIAMAMLARQQLDIQRTMNMLDQTQAYQYALGAEELARQVLAADAMLTPGLDYPGQRWARLREGVPVEHGTLFFYVEDLQGRFNLNTLIGADPSPLNRFQQLLAVLKLRKEIASAIVAKLGTKDAPSLFASIKALQAIPDITKEEYAALAPFVSALPETEPLLNVNTASATVLKAYLPNEDNYNLMINTMAKRGFVTQPQLNGIGMSTKGMTSASHYFSLVAEAQVDGRMAILTSVIHRETDAMGGVHLRVISRDMSSGL